MHHTLASERGVDQSRHPTVLGAFRSDCSLPPGSASESDVKFITPQDTLDDSLSIKSVAASPSVYGRSTALLSGRRSTISMGHLTARLSEGWPPPRLLGGRLAVCWVPSPVAIRLMGGHLLGCWVAPRTPDGRPPDNLLGGCPPVLWVAARLLWSRLTSVWWPPVRLTE